MSIGDSSSRRKGESSTLPRNNPARPAETAGDDVQVPDIILVRLVKEHFSSDRAVSRFEEWCVRNGITYEAYSI